MDSDKFVQKLSEVFNFLLNLREPITDDTCLQRLLDVLHERFSDGHCPSMKRFIDKVCETAEQLEPSVVVFTLHLVGQTLSQGNISQSAKCLYRTISEKDLWKNTSVGTAYFDSLTEVGKTSHCCQWLIQEKSDFLQQALASLKENASIFLHSSARQLLTTIFKQKDEEARNAESIHADQLDNLSRRICQDFTTELKQTVAPHCKAVGVYLQNLMAVVGSSDHLLQQVGNQEEVLLDLFMLCLKCQMGSSTVCEDLLIQYLKMTNIRETEKLNKFFWTRYVSLCSNGLNNIDVCRFHKLTLRLYQSFPEVDNSAMLKDVIMVPFRVVSRQKQPATSASGCISAFENAMITKTQCTQLMQGTIKWISGQDGSVKDLVSILQYTQKSKEEDKESGAAGQIQQNLLNSRLQLSCLEGIHENIGKDDTVPLRTLTDAFDIIIKITSEISVHNRVLEKGLECIVSLLVALTHVDGVIKSYLPLVTSHVEKCLVSTQWEHRDTAVEFVTKLATRLQDNAAVMSVTASTQMLVSAWKCITDSDSYVRASTIRLAAKLVLYPHIWKVFLSQLGQTEEDIINKLKGIICTDTEAFPRRASVLCLLEIYSNRQLSESVSREISSVMVQAMRDFDWEVKSNALDFWQFVCDEKLLQINVPDYAACLLQSGTKRKSNSDNTFNTELLELNKTGFFVALLSGLDDYDQHVCVKTNTILHNLKQKIHSDDLDDNMLKKSKSENGLATDHVVALASFEPSYDCVSNTDCLKSVLKTMRDTDFEEKLSMLSESVDEYSRNPIALLEDILSEDKDIKEEKFVDCY